MIAKRFERFARRLQIGWDSRMFSGTTRWSQEFAAFLHTLERNRGAEFNKLTRKVFSSLTKTGRHTKVCLRPERWATARTWDYYGNIRKN